MLSRLEKLNDRSHFADAVMAPMPLLVPNSNAVDEFFDHSHVNSVPVASQDPSSPAVINTQRSLSPDRYSESPQSSLNVNSFLTESDALLSPLSTNDRGAMKPTSNAVNSFADAADTDVPKAKDGVDEPFPSAVAINGNDTHNLEPSVEIRSDSDIRGNVTKKIPKKSSTKTLPKTRPALAPTVMDTNVDGTSSTVLDHDHPFIQLKQEEMKEYLKAGQRFCGAVCKHCNNTIDIAPFHYCKICRENYCICFACFNAYNDTNTSTSRGRHKRNRM